MIRDRESDIPAWRVSAVGLDGMKVDEPKSVERAAPVGRHGQAVDPSAQSPRPGEEHGSRREDRDAPEPHDVAALHGVDEEELTPSARQAMFEMVGEIAKLRQEIAHLNNRVSFLSGQADVDALAPVLNRRAFLRELAHAQRLVHEFKSGNTLAFLTVHDLGAVNAAFGHAAGDAVVEHVGEVLRHHTTEGDVVGRLGGAEFAVVLVGEQGESAANRVRGLVAAIETRPVHWNGHSIFLRVRAALHALGGDETAEEALVCEAREGQTFLSPAPGAGDDAAG